MKHSPISCAMRPWQWYAVGVFVLLVPAVSPGAADEEAAAANKISYTFKLLVDTSMTVPPDNKVKFAGLYGPAISVTPQRTTVAYDGFAVNEQGEVNLRGVYVSDPNFPAPVRVVDTTRKAPDGRLFVYFSRPAIESKTVAFSAEIKRGGTGLYVSVPDYLAEATVADENTKIPGGAGNFSLIAPAFSAIAALSGKGLAFWGAGRDGLQGIYVGSTLKLAKVADVTTEIPSGLGKFVNGFGGNRSINEGKVAFVGFVSLVSSGIYIGIPGQKLVTLADKTVACPDRDGRKFSDAVAPSISNGTTAFVGLGCSAVPGTGIYSGVPGGLRLVADDATPVPNSNTKFRWVTQPSQSGPKYVAFLGGDGSRHGIYLWVDGSLQTVVDTTMKLDDKTPLEIDFDRNGLDGEYLAFRVKFSDNSQAIYLAIPKK